MTLLVCYWGAIANYLSKRQRKVRLQSSLMDPQVAGFGGLKLGVAKPRVGIWTIRCWLSGSDHGIVQERRRLGRRLKTCKDMMTKTLALGLIWAFLVIERQCDAAILNPMPPKGGKQIALAHLKDAVTNPGFTLGQRPDFLRLPINEMVLSEPHQTYHANLTNVATGSLLSKARLFSWRYLVLHAHKGVAEVELNANEKSGAIFRFLSLSDGHYADATLAALRQADTSPEFRGRDYQLRLLKVPALHLVAVWLQRDSEDVLIPLSPAPRGLTVNRAYSEAEIVEVLIPLAKQTIISSEKPGTPEGFSVRKHE